jgi:DNA-3-methyladenine glycosylase
MANRTLKPDFYQRDALIVARELVGKFLVKDDLALMITEVEAYVGPQDLACHAAKGRTKRTEVMFGPGGVWYVYFVYGMHWMLNIVTGAKDYPSAVLIRGVEGVSGPARVTKSFGITKEFNGLPATPKTGLYITEDPNIKHPMSHILSAPRIGVSYAGPIWSKKPYRFLLE